MSLYKEADVPLQAGRTVLITGANTGIGWEAARVLASRGARVLLGCRSASNGRQAMERIRAVHADADLACVQIDLASLASVQRAAAEVAKEPQLDVLINNAGIMVPPYGRTEDGFELQFGVNHLGHFALTAHLLPMLREREGARVVTVSSAGHKAGRMQFEDPHAERHYSAGARYAMSKLANLLFTKALQQRLTRAGSPAIAVACHPGAAATELSRHLPQWLTTALPLIRPFINSAAEGALPILMAATLRDAQGNDYFGPVGFMELARSAGKVKPSLASQNDADAARLWALSVELTGVSPEI